MNEIQKKQVIIDKKIADNSFGELLDKQQKKIDGINRVIEETNEKVDSLKVEKEKLDKEIEEKRKSICKVYYDCFKKTIILVEDTENETQ